MKQVQKPKKPLYYYYGVALLILMCFNLLAMPYMAEKQVKNIDYGTFMTMTDDKDIGRVEIQSNQIIFTDKAEKNIYKTGPLNDPGLVVRLHEAGGGFKACAERLNLRAALVNETGRGLQHLARGQGLESLPLTGYALCHRV